MKHLFPSLLLLSLSLTLVGQNRNISDTLQARIYWEEADTLYDSGDYGQALTQYIAAHEILQELLAQQVQTDTLLVRRWAREKLNLGYCYYEVGAYDTAAWHMFAALEEMERAIGPEHPEFALGYEYLGNFHMNLGYLPEAKSYLEQALELGSKLGIHSPKEELVIRVSLGITLFDMADFEASKAQYLLAKDMIEEVYGPDHVNMSIICSNLGPVYRAMQQYDKAIEINTQALKISLAQGDPNDPQVGNSYLNLGVVYEELGQLDKALFYYQKAKEIFEQQPEELSRDLANVHNNIGVIYQKRRESNLATAHHQRAIDIRTRVFGPNHYEVANSYLNLGTVQSYLGNWEAALSLERKALEIYRQSLGPDHPDVIMTLLNISSILGNLDSLDAVEQMLLQAQQVLNARQEPSDPHWGLLYSQFGDMSWDRGDNQAARRYFEKSITEFQQIYGPQHPDIAEVYMHVAMMLRTEGNFEAGLIEVDNSLLANGCSPDSLPCTPLSSRVYLGSILLRSQLIGDMYPGADTTLATYEFMLSELERYRGEMATQEDQLASTQIYHEAFTELVDVNFARRDLLTNPSALDKFFQGSERSKGGVLWEAAITRSTLDAAWIPDTLIELQAQLGEALTRLESAYLIGAYSPITDSNYFSTSQLRSEAQAIREKQDSIKRIMRDVYPDFYHLVYQEVRPELKQIQQELRSDQTLLSYALGQDNLYLLFLRRDTSFALNLGNFVQFKPAIEEFRTTLHSYYTTGGGNFKENSLNSLALGYELYSLILAPVEHLLTEKLIIVPDGELGYIPFGALISEPVCESRPEIPYLIQRHTISYAYSISLWEQMQRSEIDPAKDLLVIAPDFQGKQQTLTRGFLGPLYFAEEETQAISQHYPTVSLTGNLATRQKVLEEISEYNILHFATHGVIREELGGSYSYLALFGPGDSVWVDNQVQYDISGLFLADLYHLYLNADLVVLSACNTGVGQLFSGEGIASLARGFAFAGAKSVVHTLWSINGESTSQLMADFYEQLAAGVPKDEALRHAQLQAIEQGLSPYYWAAFIPVGDMRPVTPADHSPVKLIALILGIILLVGSLGLGYFWNKKSRK